MIKWAQLFTQTIRQRGKEYYDEGYVKNLKKSGDQYTAYVTDGALYRVSVTIINSDVTRMSCTCSYAKSGRRCKHMAAMLYKIDEQQEEFALDEARRAIAVTDEDMNSFPQNYTYFDTAAMKKELVCPDTLWREAIQMAKGKRVVMDSASTGYWNQYSSTVNELGGEVEGHMTVGKTSYPIHLYFDRKRITNAYCNVRGCTGYFSRGYYTKPELCVHQWALFYLLKEYLKENPLGDATDYRGQIFLNRVQNMRTGYDASEASQEKELFDLEPRLQAEQGGWSLSFRLGGSKKYVVKNLTELAGHAQQGEYMTFGSSTRWRVAPDCFTELGKRYLKFIQEIVDAEYQRGMLMARDRYSASEYQFSIKSSVPLFGRYLDDFFELQEPRKLEQIVKEGGKKKTEFLTLIRKNPQLTLTIKKSQNARGHFEGITVSGKLPQIIYGQKAAYYIEKDNLCQIDAEYSERMEPLFHQEIGGKLKFHIGRNRLRDFYYTVLPWLREQASIREQNSEEIQSYLPPEARLAFYLDYEDSDMTCRATASYGEQTASIQDVLTQSKTSTLFIGDTPRDIEKEKQAAEQTLQFFPYINKTTSMFCCNGEEDLIYQVLNEGVDRLSRLGDVHATDRFRRLSLRRSPKFSVGVSVDSQLLNLSISSDQIPQEELLAILDSYRKKKKFYRLKDGNFLKLEEENSIELLDQLMTSLKLSPKEFTAGKMQVPAYRALYLEKMLEKNDSFYTRRDRHFRTLLKDFKTIEESDFEAPESLQNVLRPYQATGYQWLKTLSAYGFGGILADEMGLGKTIQVIAVLLSEQTTLAKQPALIVTPASLVYNWGEEFRRFAPELRVKLVVGQQAERAQMLAELQEADVLVTSYDLLKRDIAEYEGLTFSYEILDEAQYIKNHSTAAAKTVKIIKSRIRYALTGTPIENRLSELWSIFDYLMPGFLYSYESFRREIETPIVKNSDEAASERLKKMVSPFILRRLKTEVLKDLPDKLEEVRFAQFGSAQQKLYDGQVLHMKQVLEKANDEEFQKNKLQILAELTRLRQVCCDPSLCYEDYKEPSAKREICMELIQSAIEGEHKILLFSQFTSMLELLEQDLTAAKISYYKITGNTPKAARLEMVQAFNADTTPVFLISLKAGGTGLNLTGADVVIHYDPWWNLAVQNQATDRAHRIGQQKVVTVFKLIAKGSIEENILRMQNQKKDLADAILEGETGGLGKLSREELMELIGG